MSKILEESRHLIRLFEIQEEPGDADFLSGPELKAAEFDKLFRKLEDCHSFFNQKLLSVLTS